MNALHNLFGHPNPCQQLPSLHQHPNQCPRDAQYLLTLSPTPSLVIRHREAGVEMKRWGADILRYLISTGALPRQYHRLGTYPCNKDLVWHLLLAATAAQMSLQQINNYPAKPTGTSMTTIKTIEQLREIVGEPHPELGEKNIDHIDDYAAAFIADSPFIVLSTADAEGRVDASPKGDSPGFVWVEEKKTIIIPDRPGNKLAYGHQNIIANPNVGVLFVIPQTNETLRVNGRAELTSDESVLEKLAARGKPAVLAIRVTVEECFFHCGKAFIRSELWHPDEWKGRHRVSFGEMYAQRKSLDNSVAEAIDDSIDQDYRLNL